jgi:hypothetical protein
MPTIKNVSPLGDLVIPALGITVLAGATATVSDEAAASLLEQTENWVAADSTAAAPAPTETPSTAAPDSPVASA